MTQSTDLLLSDQPGLGFRAELNSIISALASAHKGGSAPSYAIAGMTWVDDTASPWVVKQYDGADWITVGKLNPTTNQFKLSNSADAADLAEVPTIKQVQNSSGVYGTTTGASGAYALDLGSGLRPTAYVAGQEFKVKINHSNPGACTLNVMGSSGTALGAKDIKLNGGLDPAAGALPADCQVTLRYDGTSFIVIGLPASINENSIDSGAAAAGEVLTADGLGGVSFTTPPSSGIVISIQAFTSSGTYTKPADLLYAVVEVVGGGGNGGGSTGFGSGGGGGGGGYARKVISNSAIGATETVSVGGVGGTSSFGAHCSATGGSTGGTASDVGYTSSGGGGGNGVGGDINIQGSTGRSGVNASPSPGTSSGNLVMGGDGGNSAWGAGGGNGAKCSVGGTGFASGSGGATRGAGGGGGASLGAGAWNGGSGVAGVVIVTEYRSV